ncbi:hypothetical protein ERO13_A01G150700v2 [Gossypium hirsutum]|uniref:Uncharacterized protein n=3 Tax=Gossypium TaxID=3633 RepID=A0A5J5WZM7_GOSBA|nr:hypothetical protein ES319_A01G161000v1 [Gossypium barbadense]KAG4215018.1 hypothetical protein ERO13_A01G150700v2 [Gossypium hirsutum]TYH31451.1 hypothetical protein ES288_A01G174300v1 [Gossypium darwinii]TYI43612.1 hypothetical protein ES332_A01G181600v1 [Gossypium tomentosum]
MARFRRCGETAVRKKPLVEAVRGNYSWDQSVAALAHSRNPWSFWCFHIIGLLWAVY